MLEPGVGTVPEHRWGAGRAWCPAALLGLPALSLFLSPLPETPGCRRAVPGQRRGPLRRRALTPGFSPQPGAEGVPRAAPGVSPAPSGAGRGRAVGEGCGRCGRQAALGRARPRVSQQVRSPASARGRREGPASGGLSRGPSVPGRAGVGWAGSNVFGDWRLCVRCPWPWALGSNGLAGVQEWEPERKHVESLGVRVQGGGCPPSQPVLPLEAPSPWSDRFREVFQSTQGAAGSSGWRPSLPAPRGLRPSANSEVEQGRATRFSTCVSDKS